MSLEDLPAPDGGGSKKLFETVNVLDPRLCVQDSIQFGVERSGAQVTFHNQQASSATTAGCTFDVVVPSLSTLISRKVLIRTTLQFTVSVTVPANGGAGGFYALLPNTLCLAPFAFHQLCNVMNCTINNQTFTFNCKDQLNEILRCLDKEVLAEYNNYTPVQLDYYAKYSDVAKYDNAGALNNNFESILDSPFRSAGALGGDGDIKCRGSFPLTFSAVPQNATNGAVAKTFDVTVNIVEPLIMSPFLLSTMKSSNAAALYGVQNMNFNFQFRSDAWRALRGALLGANPSIAWKSVGPIVPGNTYLEFQFLTPPPSLRLPARNIVPYLHTQCFLTTIAPSGGTAAPGDAVSQESNTIQLASIPDKVLIFARKVNKTFADSDTYLGLDPTKYNGNISIQFNNVPGILSGAATEQLYEMSRNAGVNMTYNEWVGTSQITVDNPPADTRGDANGCVQSLQTAGAVIALRFGHDIPIPNEYYCPGSIGQFSWQCNVSFINNTGANINSGDYQLGMIFIYSGMIVTSLGSTSSYTGLITKQECLDAAEKPVVNQGAYQRIWGGGWWSSLKSGMSKAAKYAVPAAKAAMAAHGSGYSAGGQSAGSKLKSRLY